jgi:hypothetical protein
MQMGTIAGEAAENNSCHSRCRSQRLGNGRNRDAGRAFGGEAIHAGGDRGKCHGRKRVGLTEFEGTAIAGGEQLVLAIGPAMPDRADGMDHMPGRQPVPSRDLGVAGRAAVERAAFLEQFRAGAAMDRTIDAAPTEQGRIRCVDDSVNAQGGDVGNYDFQPRLADLARGGAQAEAAALTTTPLSVNSCCNSPAWNISRMISQPPMNSPLT